MIVLISVNETLPFQELWHDPKYLSSSSLWNLRTQTFKLKPLKMSSDLISQLRAVALKLEGCTDTLQSLIGQKKSKNKHYADINREAFLTPCIFIFIRFTCSHFCRWISIPKSRPHNQWSSDLGRWRNIWRWQKSGLNFQRLWLKPANVQPILQRPRPELRHLRRQRLHLLQLQHRWIWWIAKKQSLTRF